MRVQICITDYDRYLVILKEDSNYEDDISAKKAVQSQSAWI